MIRGSGAEFGTGNALFPRQFTEDRLQAGGCEPRLIHTKDRPQTKVSTMLSWAITFLVIAIIAAVLGFSGVAGTAGNIAYILAVLFVILFVASLIFGRKSAL